MNITNNKIPSHMQIKNGVVRGVGAMDGWMASTTVDTFGNWIHVSIFIYWGPILRLHLTKTKSPTTINPCQQSSPRSRGGRLSKLHEMENICLKKTKTVKRFMCRWILVVPKREALLFLSCIKGKMHVSIKQRLCQAFHVSKSLDNARKSFHHTKVQKKEMNRAGFGTAFPSQLIREVLRVCLNS